MTLLCVLPGVSARSEPSSFALKHIPKVFVNIFEFMLISCALFELWKVSDAFISPVHTGWHF
jgi:hypothetical protein